MFGNQTSQVGAITNIYQGTAKILMIPDLTSDDTWYLADTSKPIKPFVWVLREPVSFAYRVSPTDPIVFDRNEYLFGARGRGEGGFGFPWLCHRSTASA